MMKKIKIKKTMPLFWMVSVMIFGACQKEDTDAENTAPLSRIPENHEYSTLPLIDTRWQLIGFANEKTGRIKKVHLSSPHSFTLSFTDEGELWGYTATNVAKGKYELLDDESNKIKILGFAGLTYVNEMNITDEYEEALLNVDRYHIASRGLSLHYSPNNFLLFGLFVE